MRSGSVKFTAVMVVMGLSSSLFAGEKNRVRASAKERLASVSEQTDEQKMAASIEKVISSGRYQGERGQEVFLADFDQAFDAVTSQALAGIKKTQTEELISKLEIIRKSAQESGDVSTVRRLDEILTGDRDGFKERLASYQFKAEKASQRKALEAKLAQYGGSVHKFLFAQKEKLLTRDYESAKKWNNLFLFPATGSFLNEFEKQWNHHQAVDLSDAGNCFVIAIAIPLIAIPIDMVLLSFWTVGFPFALIF